ncbi:MAG TPA: hypothetical protein VKY31_06615 [Terriglobia bacterium]|nr:hypothetical protein [Terriglobia bacterium]
MSCKKFLHIALIITLLAFVAPLPAQSADDPGGSAGDPAKIESKPEPKRLFGVVPNYRTTEASNPFSPLSPKQKLSIATHDSFDWPTYVTAGILTVATPTSEYGTGVSGFASRYFRWSAGQITGNMLTEGIMPVVLHQDPRYFRIASGSLSSRFWGSLVQTIVAKNDSGRRTLNTSEWVGNAMAVGISNTYSDHLNSWSQRSETLLLMVGSDTFSNLIKEFGPDIRQHLPHRHKG